MCDAFRFQWTLCVGARRAKWCKTSSSIRSHLSVPRLLQFAIHNNKRKSTCSKIHSYTLTQRANHFGYCCCCFALSLTLWIPLFLIIISLFFHFSLQLASSSSHIAYFRNMYSSSSFNSLVRSFVLPFLLHLHHYLSIYSSHFHSCYLFIFQSYSMRSIFNIAK